jgi:hypothetical protein
VKAVKQNLWQSGQSWQFESIVSISNDDETQRETFRVDIRRNAYDDQSYWRVEVWRQNGWTFVTSLPCMMAASAAVSYVQKDVDSGPFLQDRDTLLNYACEVVF